MRLWTKHLDRASAYAFVSELSPEFIRYLTDRISHLPDDVVRIEEANRVISVYWHERSEEAGLQSIVEFLTGCLAIKPIPDVSDQ